MTEHSEQEGQILHRIHQLQANIEVETNSRWIFDRYYRRLLGFFRQRNFTSQRAEELTQDTFLQVFQKIRSFSGRGSFDSWLFAIAANVCRNEWRSRQAGKRDVHEIALEAEAPDIPPRQIVDDQESPDQELFSRERQEAVHRAIQELPPQMRACLTLRIDQDMKYREIATLLKLSIETVKVHLFQARRRLKDELGKQFGILED